MKKHLPKTLLMGGAILSLMLCTSTVSKAQTSTLYERGTTTAWSDNDLSSWSTPTKGTLSIANNALTYTVPSNSGKLGNYTSSSSTLPTAPTEKSKITFNAVWNVGQATGANNTYSILSIGDLKFKWYGSAQKGTVQAGDEGEVTLTNLNDKTTRGTTWTISATIDQATGSISYSISTSNKKSASGTITHTGGTYSTLTFGMGGKVPKWENSTSLSSISVTEEKQNVTTATYTVKYVYNSTEIKTAETRTGIVNQAPELESSDKDDIKVTTDGVLSAKYIYSSDDAASQTIASDGSTVITVNFREASKYTYTINAVGGSKTVQLASGSNFEGETLSVAYPRYLLDGTDLYKKEPISNDYHQTYTLTGNLEENLTYTKDLSNVVYYKEAEDIEGMTTANGSSANIRCSMGVGGFNGGDTEVALATLPAGSYSMIASTRGSGDGSLPINIAGTKWDVQTHGYNVTETKAFTLSEEGAVTVPTGGNNKNMFDFFVIQKIATPSAAITSAKYATYVAQGNVTIPSGVTAYTVKLDGESLTYTALDASTVIPEGTALLLYGEAKTYEFPYTLATASTITDNSLKASTGEGVTADGTQYILANVDGTLGFYQATTGTTIAAGKAYLEVSAETAKAVKFFGIGTTTGISNVSTTTADKGAYYNLQGMKVVRPAKGIFIHNGKKLVIK